MNSAVPPGDCGNRSEDSSGNPDLQGLCLGVWTGRGNCALLLDVQKKKRGDTPALNGQASQIAVSGPEPGRWWEGHANNACVVICFDSCAQYGRTALERVCGRRLDKPALSGAADIGRVSGPHMDEWVSQPPTKGSTVSTTAKRPRVFISYTWRPAANKDKAYRLAENLRAHGFDVRIDVYFKDSQYSFSPPQPDLNDQRDPWIVWAESEIKAADCVLLLCTEQYAASDADGGAQGGEWFRWHELPYERKLAMKVPYVWWDWHAMLENWESDKQAATKFVPLGFGQYTTNAQHIPGFLRGATYCNLDSKSDFDGLLRRIRAEFRKRHPRLGVFVSYAHDDEPVWINARKNHLAFLERKGIRIWTDEDIKPGERWHDEIQDALATAKVAVLQVSPNFLSSQYIASHELPHFLEAAQSDGLTIFWVPVKPSSYKESEIGKFQAAHSPDQPLSALRGAKRDGALVRIASKLSEALGIAAGGSI